MFIELDKLSGNSTREQRPGLAAVLYNAPPSDPIAVRPPPEPLKRHPMGVRKHH